MPGPLHVILDTTGLAAIGGNLLASRLIHRAHAEPGWHLYTTACALVEADRVRPGTGVHVAQLPAVTVLDLDLPAALAVAGEATWGPAHTLYTAQPTPDRPAGAYVATTAPQDWEGKPVRVFDLNP